MHPLLPVDDVATHFGSRVIGNGVFPTKLPVHKVLLEFFVGHLDPVLDEFFPLLPLGKRRLWKLPFDLGDVDLLSGAVHEKIDRIEHGQLERELLVLFDVVVGEFFRALADFLCCPVGSVGQNVADPLPPDDLVEQVVEPVFGFCRQVRQVLVGENAFFVKLQGKGHHLGCGKRVHAVFGCPLGDFQAEVEVGKCRHGVRQLAEAFHHVGGHPRRGDGRPAFHRAVVAADQACPGMFHAFAISSVQKPFRRTRELPHMKFSVCHFSSWTFISWGEPSPAKIGMTPLIGLSSRHLM